MDMCQLEKQNKLESLKYSLGNSLCNAEQALTQIISTIFDSVDNDNLKMSDEQFMLEFTTFDISLARRRIMETLQKISSREHEEERSR